MPWHCTDCRSQKHLLQGKEMQTLYYEKKATMEATPNVFGYKDPTNLKQKESNVRQEQADEEWLR